MKNLNKLSKKLQKYAPQWEMVDTLWGGTPAMRKAGEKYLPKEPKESTDNYLARLSRSYLFNAYKRTVKKNVGKIFDKPIEITSDNNQILDFSEDVDLTGRDLTEFSISVFEDALHSGYSCIFCDYTKVVGTGPNGLVTKQDELDQNARPYLIHIKRKQVRSIVSKVIKGVDTITYFRYVDIVENFDPNDHTESQVEIVRCFKLEEYNDDYIVKYESYIYDNDNDEWVLIPDETGYLSTNINKIPIVCFVTNRVDTFTGSPPLIDLAEKNVELWQSASDQKNILHYARVPILSISDKRKPKFDEYDGFDEQNDDNKFVLSGNTILELTENGSAKWVEHEGRAIKSGENDITTIKHELAVLGLELHTAKTSAVTATEKSLDKQEVNSWLKTMAVSYNNTLYEVFGFITKYLNINNYVLDIKTNTDYSASIKVLDDMNYLLQMFDKEILTDQDIIGEAQNRNMLSNYNRPDRKINNEV